MGKHRSTVRDFHFNWHFISSCWHLGGLIYPKLEWAALLTVVTIVTAIGREIVNYFSGLNLGKFYGALLGADEDAFWTVFVSSTLWYIALCALVAIVNFWSWCLYISMRKNAVTKLQNLYFTNKAYYRINCVDDQGVDNPDQRICQDVERACNILAINIMPTILLCPFTIGWYTYKTATIAGAWGVGMIYGYFIIGTIVNRVLISPLAKWSARVERAEGNFRYKHVNVRDHSEETAFYKGEDFENSEVSRLFDILFSNQRTQLLWKLPADFFQIFFNYFGGSLSYAVQVFPIFIFHMYDDVDPDDLGTIVSNNSFVLIYLVNSFTNLTDLAMSIGDFAGYVQRITEFESIARSYAAEHDSISAGHILSEHNEKGRGVYINKAMEDDKSQNVTLTNVSIAPPTENEALVKELSISVAPYRHLLVTGPSGVGKTSILRCLAHLWPLRSGRISFGDLPKGTVFLPQRPYFPVGGLSLKQQMVYPLHAAAVPDHENTRLIGILNSLNLGRLLVVAGDLTGHVDFEWKDQLSPGEQQRLSIARVLFQRPSLAILDEATSSLSESAEREVYILLKKESIGYLSTGHRSSLFQFHDEILQIGIDRSVSTFPTDEIRY